MIYLYAIIDAGAEIPATSGFDDAPLQVLPCGEIAALYSAHSESPARPEPAALLRHEEVVEEAMRNGPAIPARFGTTFAVEADLRAAVCSERDRLRHQLGEVQGRVELAVRVGLPSADDPQPSTGRGYLEDKLARRTEVERVISETLAPLRELAERSRHAEGRTEGNVLRASYLVRKELVERFADQVRLLSEGNPELWLSCTGPWPPYSFVDLEEAA